jgi:hypothetical protein
MAPGIFCFQGNIMNVVVAYLVAVAGENWQSEVRRAGGCAWPEFPTPSDWKSPTLVCRKFQNDGCDCARRYYRLPVSVLTSPPL